MKIYSFISVQYTRTFNYKADLYLFFLLTISWFAGSIYSVTHTFYYSSKYIPEINGCLWFHLLFFIIPSMCSVTKLKTEDFICNIGWFKIKRNPLYIVICIVKLFHCNILLHLILDNIFYYEIFTYLVIYAHALNDIFYLIVRRCVDSGNNSSKYKYVKLQNISNKLCSHCHS